MSAVLLASQSTDLARRVRIASDDSLTVIRTEQLPGGPAQLLALASEPEAVTTVVIDVREGQDLAEHALALATRFDSDRPDIKVLIVSERAQELALPALRSGVRDVLPPETAVEDLRLALRRAEAARRGESDLRGDGYSGRVVTVASPKGGVGKTTVATNLARALTNQSPQGTLLVDLDMQFGDVAAALDLDPDYTMMDMVDDASLRDPIALKALLARHPSGLQVACGVKSPVEAEALTAGRISQLLEVLKHEFRFVVVDTAPGMTEHTLAALDHTTDLVLVTSLDVPGVRGLRKEIEILDQLGMAPYTRHIVVNYQERATGLTIADVEETIGRKVDVVLPRTSSVMRSTNVGSPIVELSPRDRVSRALVGLASRFAPAGAHRAARPGKSST